MCNEQEFLDASIKTAYNICKDALWSNGRCNWITAQVEETNQTSSIYFKSLDSDFYSGTSGIAFFLTALYDANPDRLLKKTAFASLEQSVSQLHKIEGCGKIGFYTGLTGIIYTALYMYKVFEDERYKKIALGQLDRLYDIDLKNGGIDIINGCAGAIPVLIQIQQQYPSAKIISFIEKIADHLIFAAKKNGPGLSWNTIETGGQNLTGYAHGAAGIASAFLELYNYSKDKKYLDIAVNAFSYENYFYDAKQQNWPDFRHFLHVPQQGSYPCSCGWCHGAPGIGLSRLRAFELNPKEEFKKDALNAIETTLRNNIIELVPNFSLCHGLFGNAELLILGSQVLGDGKLLEAAKKIAAFGIEHYLCEQTPFPNGLNNSYYNPTFMLGEAGIGYYYLRLFDSIKYPSVLSLSS
jgi:type 2 lantibiotic biosynthesis protein LanM